MNKNKCNSFNICVHGDEVGISLQKCKTCKKLSNFSMKRTDISNLKVSKSGEVVEKKDSSVNEKCIDCGGKDYCHRTNIHFIDRSLCIDNDFKHYWLKGTDQPSINYGTPIPENLKHKPIVSLTDILWRELKKHHKEYCERLSLNPDEYWGKYQIHLIKESQGE